MAKKDKKSKKTTRSRKKSHSRDEYIGFKLVKPVPQSELLPDYEKVKNLNLPSALKASYIVSLIPKETIENQSDNKIIERDQSQIDTSIKTIPVSNLDQYQDDTSIKTTPVSNLDQPQTDATPKETAESTRTSTKKRKTPDKSIAPIKIKQIPDLTNEKVKFKPGFFSQWEISIFNELRKILSNSEFKIYTALFEESWTYGRNLTNIIGFKTLSEKTGLARATVIRSIEKLIRRKIIEKRTSFNNLGTIYKVNLPESAEIQFQNQENPQSAKRSLSGNDPPENQSQNDTSTGIKMIPVLVSKRYQSPQNLSEETIENQSVSKNQDIYNTYNYIHIYNTEETIENQSKPVIAPFKLNDEDKFIFENNLIKILTPEEIKNTLKAKPFSLKEEIIEMLIQSAPPELLSLKIHNAIFNYRKNLTKKPGEWLILSIYNNYKTTKQFLNYLKEKLRSTQKTIPTNPLDEHMIKTVFGYSRKFLKVIPTKEVLQKELQRFDIPEQMISKIINTYPPEYIFFQILRADFERPRLKDPASWLVNAITKVYKPSREFAQKIEQQIKQIEEEKAREEKNRKIEEERIKTQKALEFFNSLPQTQKEEILKLAQQMLNELNITPETPGYKINLEYKIASIIITKFNLPEKEKNKEK